MTRTYFTTQENFAAFAAKHDIDYVTHAGTIATDADISAFDGVISTHGIKAETKSTLDALMSGEAITPPSNALAERDQAYAYVAFSNPDDAQSFACLNEGAAIGRHVKYRLPPRSGLDGVNKEIVVPENVRDQLDALLS